MIKVGVNSVDLMISDYLSKRKTNKWNKAVFYYLI